VSSNVCCAKDINEAILQHCCASWHLQAYCRTLQYQHLPPEQVTAAPEAKWFPGLPPAGTAPLGEVTVMVGWGVGGGGRVIPALESNKVSGTTILHCIDSEDRSCNEPQYQQRFHATSVTSGSPRETIS
jgi:hypothetical protein